MQDERTDDLERTPPRRRSSGCLLWGCISAVIVVVILIGFGYFGWREYVELVKEYTETEPRELPAAELPEGEIPGVLARWDAFDEAMESGEPARLELTPGELNALIQNSPDWSTLKDSVYLGEIDDENRLHGQFSLPLDERIPYGKGRYFNGTATFDLTSTEEGLRFKVFEAEGKGKALPEGWLESSFEIRSEPLQDVDKVEVRDGKVLLASEEESGEGEG